MGSSVKSSVYAGDSMVGIEDQQDVGTGSGDEYPSSDDERTAPPGSANERDAAGGTPLLAAAAGGSAEAAAVLLRFGRVILEKMMSPTSIALHRLLVSEAERVPTMGQAFAERGPDRLRRRLCQWMEGEMAGGRLRTGDPLLAARQFVALCQAGCYIDRLWRPIGSIRIDIEADVGAAVNSFMGAWGPDPR